MIIVKFLGGSRKIFGTSEITIEDKGFSLRKLIEYLQTKKSDESMIFDTKNTIFAINGTDSSVLEGLETQLNQNDIVSIIPIIHGGNIRRIIFSEFPKTVELFFMKKN